MRNHTIALSQRPCLILVLLTLLSEVPVKKKKLGKNPDVDTSFLPDREREVRCTDILLHAETYVVIFLGSVKDARIFWVAKKTETKEGFFWVAKKGLRDFFWVC